jgi:hypothetical protein
MSSITMIRTAVALLAIGALGGAVMAIIRFFKAVNPPAWLAMLHGFLAAAAASLLLYAALTVGIPQLAGVGLALLLIAAVVGIFLNLNYQWNRVPLPRGLTIGHAVLAVVGFALVFYIAWKGQ